MGQRPGDQRRILLNLWMGVRCQWAASVAVVAAVFLVGATACGSDQVPSAESDLVGLAFGEQLVSIEDAQAQFEQELARFVAGEERFAECAQQLGFDYEIRTVSVTYPEGDRLLTFEEERRQNGYGVVRGEGIGGVQVSIDGGVVPADQREAFVTEVQERGECADRLYPNDLQELFFELRLTGEAPPDRLLADPRIVAAEKGWVECMREGGFEYADRAGPFNDVESRLRAIDRDTESAEEDLNDLFEYEVKVATADVECHIATVQATLFEILDE